MLLLDCRYVCRLLASSVETELTLLITARILRSHRAERKKDQVCSPGEYQRVFDRLNNLPGGVEHVILQLGIPIAYPRMVFLETALESKFNPLVALGRNGSMGLSGFVNKFNAEAELLDDLVRIYSTILCAIFIFMFPE